MNSKNGFTLIEIIVVIAIIGAVSVFAVPFSMRQITNNRAYEAAAQLSSAIFSAQQNSYAFKDSKSYSVEVEPDEYSIISSLEEDLVNDGLLAYWKFNENDWNGTTDEVIDSSNNGNHGTALMDTVTSQYGFGGSAKFDGTGDYIALRNSSDVEEDTAPLTGLNNSTSLAVSAWFRTETLSGGEDGLRYIVSKEYGGSNQTSFILRLNTSTDKIEFYLGGDSYVGTFSDEIDPNVWYHVVGTWDGSDMNLYLDGLLVDSASKTGYTGSTTYPVRIGSLNLGGNTNQRNWHGEIDEIRIYNEHLTQENVSDLYNYNQRLYSKTTIPFEGGVTTSLISSNKVINFNEGSFKPSFPISFNMISGSSEVFVEVNSEGLINYYIN